jgi:hypothetical protein
MLCLRGDGQAICTRKIAKELKLLKEIWLDIGATTKDWHPPWLAARMMHARGARSFSSRVLTSLSPLPI